MAKKIVSNGKTMSRHPLANRIAKVISQTAALERASKDERTKNRLMNAREYLIQAFERADEIMT